MEITVRELVEAEVEFRIELLEEDTVVDGYFETDEPERDRELEQEILRRLERGDRWAWCTVRVIASWNGLEGDDTLGCCSYESEEDFRNDDGYWPGMKAETLYRLNEKIKAKFKTIEPLLQKSA